MPNEMLEQAVSAASALAEVAYSNDGPNRMDPAQWRRIDAELVNEGLRAYAVLEDLVTAASEPDGPFREPELQFAEGVASLLPELDRVLLLPPPDEKETGYFECSRRARLLKAVAGRLAILHARLFRAAR